MVTGPGGAQVRNGGGYPAVQRGCGLERLNETGRFRATGRIVAMAAPLLKWLLV